MQATKLAVPDSSASSFVEHAKSSFVTKDFDGALAICSDGLDFLSKHLCQHSECPCVHACSTTLACDCVPLMVISVQCLYEIGKADAVFSKICRFYAPCQDWNSSEFVVPADVADLCIRLFTTLKHYDEARSVCFAFVRSHHAQRCSSAFIKDFLDRATRDVILPLEGKTGARVFLDSCSNLLFAEDLNVLQEALLQQACEHTATTTTAAEAAARTDNDNSTLSHTSTPAVSSGTYRRLRDELIAFVLHKWKLTLRWMLSNPKLAAAVISASGLSVLTTMLVLFPSLRTQLRHQWVFRAVSPVSLTVPSNIMNVPFGFWMIGMLLFCFCFSLSL